LIKGEFLMPIMRTPIFIALALFAGTASAEVYTWKDAEGKTHFSDQAPAGDSPSVRTVTLPDEGKPRPKPMPKPAAPVAQKKNDPATIAADKEQQAAKLKQANCEKARADLQALNDRPRQTAVSKGGKFYALDGEERAEEEAKYQKAIDANCR
jgi:hypothetical protein